MKYKSKAIHALWILEIGGLREKNAWHNDSTNEMNKRYSLFKLTD